MQLDKLLYSGNDQKQPLDKSDKKDEVSAVENKASTVKYWKNIKT